MWNDFVYCNFGIMIMTLFYLSQRGQRKLKSELNKTQNFIQQIRDTCSTDLSSSDSRRHSYSPPAPLFLRGEFSPPPPTLPKSDPEQPLMVRSCLSDCMWCMCVLVTMYTDLVRLVFWLTRGEGESWWLADEPCTDVGGWLYMRGSMSCVC